MIDVSKLKPGDVIYGKPSLIVTDDGRPLDRKHAVDPFIIVFRERRPYAVWLTFDNPLPGSVRHTTALVDLDDEFYLSAREALLAAADEEEAYGKERLAMAAHARRLAQELD
jgi:hypothetical protein